MAGLGEFLWGFAVGNGGCTLTQGISGASPTSAYTPQKILLSELARTFFTLGILGFGGPAAHIALMEKELVTRRGWLSREHFMTLLAAINLVPGPSSTEMAFHIGYVTGGVPGAILAGAGFIIPAAVLSIALAMLYTVAGDLAAVRGLFLGAQPVILVLILSAAYRLGQKVIDSPIMRVLLIGSLIVLAANISPLMAALGLSPIYVPSLPLLITTGVLYVLWRRRKTAIAALPPLIGVVRQIAVQPPAPLDLFWQFFVIGGTLFGSGYVLAPYMKRTFVDGLGWLTPQQLIDVLAIGQSTPGPVLSTASAAGYVMTATRYGNLWSGVPGALTATIGVFLPAFLIVLLLGRIVPILQRYPIALDFLKGVNAGVIALLIGAFIDLAWTTTFKPGGIDWLTLLLTGGAFIASERLGWSPLRLIATGLIIGVARAVLHLI